MVARTTFGILPVLWMCWIDLAGGGAGAAVLGSKTYQLLHKLKQT